MSNAERQRLIKLVHVAKRDLRLDIYSYRLALRHATCTDTQPEGKGSASSMSVTELNDVLRHFKTLGFKVRRAGAPQSRAQADSAAATKIRALWLMLHQLDLVENPSEEALAAYVKRIANVEALQWLDTKGSGRVIETMKAWAMRRLPEIVMAHAAQLDRTRLSRQASHDLSRTLSTASGRTTFEPWRKAWDALRAAQTVYSKEREHGQ